ncbi:MAG: ABC transporter permease [Gammaproteobacteria bacterium]
MALTWLRELWRYRELFYFFALRDVKIRYRQTLLGVLWAVVPPIFTMVVFSILFGGIVKVPTDGMPYPVFYYAALLPWTYFQTTLGLSGNSLISNAHLITKIYFPRVILPVTPVLVGLLDFMIGFVLLIAMMLFYEIVPTWRLMLWPVLLFLLALLTFTLGMFLSALNVKYRDVKYVIPFFIQLLLFITPIIYPASLVPEPFRLFVSLNPLTGIIEAFRTTCFPEQQIDWLALGISTIITLLLLVVSAIYFRKTEDYFSDVI